MLGPWLIHASTMGARMLCQLSIKWLGGLTHYSTFNMHVRYPLVTLK